MAPNPTTPDAINKFPAGFDPRDAVIPELPRFPDAP